MTNNKTFAFAAWIFVSLPGESAPGGITLNRGESINALWLVTAALSVYAIACRYLCGE
jgi:carbon starvation protein